MPTFRTSFLAGLVLIALLNALVGMRLRWLVLEAGPRNFDLLEDRVVAFPRPDRVKLVVLGNSHAIYGLRPPALARAYGAAPDTAFCLGLPGAGALSMRAAWRRYGSRFPAAREALVMIDEVLLGAPPEETFRYMTRHDPAMRLRLAAYPSSLEVRTALVAWLPFPLAEFNGAVLRGWRTDRGRTLAVLAGWLPALPDDHWWIRASSRPYPWGYPIDPFEPYDLQMLRTPEGLRKRVDALLPDPVAIPAALADLRALATELAHAGLRVRLVGGTLPPRTRAFMEGPRQEAFAAALAAAPTALGLPFEPLPPMPQADFADPDHLAASGAEAVARRLARRWPDLLAPGP